MDSGVDTTVFAAFAVGMLSFFSPCVLPLVPGYISIISGTAIAEQHERSRTELMGPAILFCLSFTAIFIALGLAATGLGQALARNRETLETIAGALVVTMGVLLALTLLVPRLNRDWHPQKLAAGAGAGGPIVAGAAFAIAWTPCVGPTLSAILGIASTEGSYAKGAVLLLFYSAGLAIPFLGAALGLGSLDRLMGWMRRHHTFVILLSSAVLVLVGTLMLTDQFFRLNIEAQRLTRSFGLDW
jgi:cytochrome c-type biogenesis protein